MSDKCYFCQDNSSLYDSSYLWGGRTDSIEIRIMNGIMEVDADVNNDNFTGRCSIKYCPMCGRNFDGGAVNEFNRTTVNQ